MYVLLDENKRFTGSYSITGGITGGTIVPSLPPCEDLVKQRFYRWDTHNIQTGINRIPVMKSIQATEEGTGELLWEDEDKTIPVMIEVQDTNEDGSLKYTEELIMEDVTEWIFNESDQLAYNNYIKEQEAIVPEKTPEEKIAALTEENVNLKLATVELFELYLNIAP